MTEAKWLASNDPRPMRVFLRGATRKAILWACGCAGRAWHLLQDPRSREYVAAVERAEDGVPNPADESAFRAHRDAMSDRVDEDYARDLAAWAITSLRSSPGKAADCLAAAIAAGLSGSNRHEAAVWKPFYNAERAVQADLLRCIFGNPFRPVALDPAWRTAAVVELTRGIYDDRAFDRLPILADALQDAGCDHDDILSHCRDAGPHARGCWVVDLVLGKA